MRQLRAALLSITAVVGAFSVQSALAADQDLPVKAPILAALIASRWDGLYASFSAGGSWTNANESFTDATSSTLVSSFFPPTFIAETITTNTTTNTVDGQSGQNSGAVFTFTMGYNVVWSAWLAGIQSEVSLNRSSVRTQGTLQSSASSTTFNTLPPNVTSASASASATVFNNLENKWTISEMARLGYLVTPDLLVYGLFGWSLGGFEWNDGVTPFTMNGPTWGAGVEKDFGWIRAFVQYKGISYLNHNVNFSSPSSNQTSNFQGGGLASTFSANVADSASRRFSADYNQVTAGITIPIPVDFFQRR